MLRFLSIKSHVHLEFLWFHLSSLIYILFINHSYLLFGETTTFRTVLSCLVVVIGFVSFYLFICRYIVGIEGEVNFSLRGTLFGVGASAVGTFYTIFLKRYLSNVIDDSWLLTFYTNFNSCLILPFISFVFSLSFLSN